MTDLVSMKTLNERVTEHIKDKFAELIPEEMWKEAVKIQTEQFLRKDLENLIQQLLKEKFTAEVKGLLESSDCNAWNSETPSEFVKELLRQQSASFMENMFGSMVQQAMYQIRNNMQTGSNYY